MVIHYGYEDIVIVTPVVTLGIFDGVHRGHKVLIDCLINRAKETGGESVVITFSPHPRLILEKDHYNLTSLQKQGLIILSCWISANNSAGCRHVFS
jgi:riboflavin kinase/FMN adenylyltransferase